MNYKQWIPFTFLFLITSICSTNLYAQSRFSTAVKLNLGVTGLKTNTEFIHRQSVSTDKISPNIAFSIGLMNSLFLDKKRRFSVSLEYLYNYSSFSKVQTYLAYNTITEAFSQEHTERQAFRNHQIFVPIKFNYQLGKFTFSSGIVNTFSLLSSLDYDWKIKEADSDIAITVSSISISTNRFKEAMEIESVYFDRRYNLQYVFEVRFDISDRLKIGMEYMDFLTENNIHHFFWAGDVVGHSIYSNQNNSLALSLLFSL